MDIEITDKEQVKGVEEHERNADHRHSDEQGTKRYGQDPFHKNPDCARIGPLAAGHGV